MYEEYDSVRLLLRFPPIFLGAFAAFFDGVFAMIDNSIESITIGLVLW